MHFCHTFAENKPKRFPVNEGVRFFEMTSFALEDEVMIKGVIIVVLILLLFFFSLAITAKKADRDMEKLYEDKMTDNDMEEDR